MNHDDVWRTIDGERLSLANLGRQVEGPIAALLLLLTARRAALPQLSGPGAAELQARMSQQPSLT